MSVWSKYLFEQAFQQFDSEGDGTADVSTMLESLRATSGSNAHVHGELGAVVRTLQACSLTPGTGTGIHAYFVGLKQCYSYNVEPLPLIRCAKNKLYLD